MRIERKTCRSPDGVTIVYSAAGAGETGLVFVHGGLANRTFFDAQLKSLSDRFRVVALDLAGHGESGKNRTKWGIAEFGADVKAVIEDEQLKRVILFGNSLGGPTVIEGALLVPDRVIGVVGIDTFQRLDYSVTQEDVRQRTTAFRNDFDEAVKGMVKSLFHEDVDPALRAEAERKMLKTSPAVVDAMFLGMTDYSLAAAARKLTVPLRAINGDLYDTDVDSARAIKADFQVVVMEHAGHYPMLERPNEFNRHARRVIKELTIQPPPDVDREFVRLSVESVASIVEREYFNPDVATRVALALRNQLADGHYDRVSHAESLASRLTRDLFTVAHDKHLAVAVVVKNEMRDSKASASATREELGKRDHFGVERTEILSGNVGYLKLTAFYRPNEAGDQLASAMSALQNADALILDMRTNRGGSPGTVALLASYLFDEPELPLFEIVSRSGDARSYSTEPRGLSGQNETRPVFVLTSSRTFSAGEGLAFLLQERHRAVIVGETTAGAANPGRSYAVNARFEVTVPNGKVVSALSGTNWEGGGVKPDISVRAADALPAAHIRALRRLLATAPQSERKALAEQLRTLEFGK